MESTRQPKLVARSINRVFDDQSGNPVQALKDFNLTVYEGEIVGLIGPSGCGKSTFLRLAAGLDPLQSGTLEYLGQPVKDVDPDRGFVFQAPTLFDWLTVRGNVAFGLKATKRYKGSEQRIQEMIDLMGLTGFEDSYPYQLSGGMQSRTSLARTFIQKPGLILLDEPLSALDAFMRASLQDEIINIWRRYNPSIILVTHDIEEAVYLCDRVVVLTARPATVIDEVVIDLERPRDRIGDEFIAIRHRILDILNSGGVREG